MHPTHWLISTQVLSSKLYLCDLGGSEQVKKSKATGQRFQEAVEINRSLTVLGRVVDALVRKNKYHVPYYESRLTTLLQPAFGGNQCINHMPLRPPPTAEHG